MEKLKVTALGDSITKAGIMKPLFEGVASISGSFWYDGFAKWLLKQEDLNCVRFHVSMGVKQTKAISSIDI